MKRSAPSISPRVSIRSRIVKTVGNGSDVEESMRLSATAFVVCVLWLGSASACDDHVGKCSIEAWRAVVPAVDGMLFIEGSATCNEGHLRIRLYDGDEFLGIADGTVQGHMLWASAMNITNTENLSIKYSIDPL